MNLAVRLVKAVNLDLQMLLVERAVNAAVPAHGESLARMHKAVQRDGRLLAGGDRVDGKARTGIDIAADKNVGLGRLIGQLVCLGGALPGRNQSADIQLAPVDLLADSTDDRFDLQGLKFAGADRLAAALLIRLAEGHLLYLQTADPAVPADDLDRRAQEAEPDTLVHGFLHFLRVGRHLGLRAAIHNIGVFRPEAHRRAADVHCNVAGTDHRAPAADLRLFAEVDLTQEVHAAEYALQLFAGNAERSRLLCTDGKAEALVAFLTQLLNGNIPADLNAASELHTHLADDVDLGIEHILLQTEVRNAECQHAAGHLVAVEHRDGVALLCQIEGAAQSRGARADNGDLFGEGFAGLVDHLRDAAGLFVQVMVGDEALDLVNGDGLVHTAAGAFRLAALVADASADRRKRVLGADQIQRVLIAALGGKLQIALHGDVCGTCHLAGGCAAGQDVLAVLAVIRVPDSPGSDVLGEFFILLRLDVHRCAELLPELQGICGADLDALGAGNAFGFVDLGHVVRADGIPRAEHQTYAQAEAGTGAAVADRCAFAGLLDVGDIVHETVFLGALDDLKRFLPGDCPCTAGADIMLGTLAHLDAHLFRQMSAAVVDAGARRAAGAGRDAEGAVLAEIVAELFVIRRRGVVPDGTLHRDHTHQAVAARKQRRHRLHADAGVFLEGPADLGMGFEQLLIVDEHLHDAGGKNLHEIAVFAGRLVDGPAEYADPGQMLGQAIDLFHAFTGLLRQVGCAALLPQAGGNGNVRLVVGHDAGEAVVFGGVFVDFVDQAGQPSDDVAQFYDFWSQFSHFSLLVKMMLVYPFVFTYTNNIITYIGMSIKLFS